MELQWPLILFTLFLAWSAGLFGTQSILALKGQARKTQLIMLVTSVVLLAVGGIAVFFHLEHWERIFNGFGHLTSGITQELIAIVVLVVVMVVYFVFLRKSKGEAEGTVPRAVAIVGIVMSVVLVCVAGMSYLMPARPAWDSAFEVLSLVGNACVLGPLTAVFIMALRKDDGAMPQAVQLALVGSVINVVTTVVFLIVMTVAGSSLIEVGNYFDPVHPTYAMQSASAANPFGGSLLVVSVCCIICAVVAAAMAFLAKKDASKVMAAGVVGLVVALIAAITLRVVFYSCGLSLFMFY